jgi:histidinol-phosphatase (PHP family)
LGVAEHVYRFSAALDVWQHPLWQKHAVDDLDAYVTFVREQTDLRLGIEADFIPGRDDRMRSLLEGRDWDYVIGSIHFIADGAVDYDKYDVWNSGRSPDHVWRTYFTWLGELAATGMYDVLAHPDLVKMWGAQRPWPDKDLRFYYDLAMEQIADSGIAVEVSTAGLRKPVGEIYPSVQFLEMVLDAGNPIALSSDAHVPDQLGFAYEQALELLGGLGVTELAVFDRRERRLEPIG